MTILLPDYTNCSIVNEAVSKTVLIRFIVTSNKSYHQVIHVHLCVSCDVYEKSAEMVSSKSNQEALPDMIRSHSFPYLVQVRPGLLAISVGAYPKMLCVHPWVNQEIYSASEIKM